MHARQCLCLAVVGVRRRELVSVQAMGPAAVVVGGAGRQRAMLALPPVVLGRGLPHQVRGAIVPMVAVHVRGLEARRARTSESLKDNRCTVTDTALSRTCR